MRGLTNIRWNLFASIQRIPTRNFDGFYDFLNGKTASSTDCRRAGMAFVLDLEATGRACNVTILTLNVEKGHTSYAKFHSLTKVIRMCKTLSQTMIGISSANKN